MTVLFEQEAINPPHHPFHFRTASEAEIPLALHFRKKLFQEMGASAEAFIPDADTVLLNLYRKEFSQGRIQHFIAYTEENVPVAIAGALIKEDFPYLLFKPGYYGWIIDVYTEPAYRGQKLATHLLELTHQWLKDKGVRESKLIAAGTDARRLYERLGFRPTWEMSLNLSHEKTYNEIIDHRDLENEEGVR